MRLFIPRTPRVFIASTADAQLRPYRDAACRVAQKAGYLPVVFEDWPPDQRLVVAACRQEVASGHALMAIVGDRYGYVLSEDDGGDGTSSITRLEVEHARALQVPVFAFLIVPAAEPPEPALADFKAELRKRVAKDVEDIDAFEKELLNALWRLKTQFLLRNVAVALAMLLVVAVGIALAVSPSEPPGPAPDPVAYVTGFVKTRKGLLPGPATVAVDCDRKATATVKEHDGSFVISLASTRRECRTLPILVSGSTIDGRRFSGQVTDPNRAALVVDEPPNRIVKAVVVGHHLLEVELERDAPQGAALMVKEFSPGATGSASRPILVGQSRSREHLVVSNRQLEPGTIVALEPIDGAALAAIVAETETQMRRGGPAGLKSLERVLLALGSAKADGRLLADVFRRVAEEWHGDTCAEREEALRWITQALKFYSTADLVRVETDLRARKTLTCRTFEQPAVL